MKMILRNTTEHIQKEQTITSHTKAVMLLLCDCHLHLIPQQQQPNRKHKVLSTIHFDVYFFGSW